jgi:hypothetical protein
MGAVVASKSMKAAQRGFVVAELGGGTAHGRRWGREVASESRLEGG